MLDEHLCTHVCVSVCLCLHTHRYYRSMVCALALAATASLQAQGSSTSSSSQAAATLHLQAAKVGQCMLVVLICIAWCLGHPGPLWLHHKPSPLPLHCPPFPTTPQQHSTSQLPPQVVSAHAASIGDTLLAVPLNCSAGLNADAVTVLQEAGLWQAAAALTARTLTGL